MIVVTGAAGFIASVLAGRLNQEGYTDLVLVDDFSREDKAPNHQSKQCSARIERSEFIDWLANNAASVDVVFHLGARTDTTEFDHSIFDELNVNYSKDVWKLCTQHDIPLVYASSAATYGLGEHGYDDNHELPAVLKPLNPYGESKNNFDQWVLSQDSAPSFWAGLKFFNVYGPNEYHKGRMASVIMHAHRQINETGKVKLFASHNPNYKDGEQLRDFVYVKDVAEVCWFLASKRPASGLYNLGTGKARTFRALAEATFAALGKAPNIEFIPTPEDIRDKYQYFTEANMQKLLDAGYSAGFRSLEDGVMDYVTQYLVSGERC